MKQQTVPFCCACGKVRDDLQSYADHYPWIDLRAFKLKHGFQLEDLLLVNTYCSDCAKFYEKVSLQGGEVGVPTTNI